MNFLEQLAAEWYEYSGYFVRTNVRARKRPKGGWDAELDILAFLPSNKKLVHIETSGDADSWSERKNRFLTKKFVFSQTEYEELIGSSISVIKRIAIAGWTRTTKYDLEWGEGIKVLLIPEFLDQITTGLHQHNFMSEAIPESYPILRTIQMMHEYQDLIGKKK